VRHEKEYVTNPASSGTAVRVRAQSHGCLQ
jgi:hypothetical protein